MRAVLGYELDADGVRRIAPLANTWAAAHENVALDLSGVSKLDSSGLGLLVFLQKRKLQQGRQLTIENVNGQPMALLQQFDLLGVLGYVTPSVTEAKPVSEAVAA